MKKRLSSIFNILLFILIVVVINGISNAYYKQFDLTGDKRFTLTEPTKKLVSGLKDQIFVKVYLEGQFPAGFNRLKEEIGNRLLEFKSLSDNFDFEFQDPSGGNGEDAIMLKENLKKDGVLPISLNYMDGDERMQKQIYPYAIFNRNNRKIAVNLLENQTMGIPEEVILNNSVSLLEYKFADALSKLTLERKPNIVFASGNGELTPDLAISLETDLREYYNTARVALDTTIKIPQEVDLLIVAKPTITFSKRTQFIIDQYIMNGGKVIWLIDYLDINVDSIDRNGIYVPPIRDLQLDELFFKYGIRFQPNLVMDLECTRIPQMLTVKGGKPTMQLSPWPFHPLVPPLSNHPIAKNLDRINLYFPSTIDTLKTEPATQKTILLKSSPYTRYQLTPFRLGFSIFYQDFEKETYTKPPQNFAVLVEGEFNSAFKNRVAKSMLDGLNRIGEEYKEKSVPTRQLFVSDGDFIKNLYNPRTDEFSAIGYNKWEKSAFNGNEAFIKNAIEYMVNPDGVLSSRSKEVKLRLLDTQKADTERNWWRFINIAVPLLFLILCGGLYNFARRRKYAH